MDRTHKIDAELQAFAAQIAVRHEAILHAWRSAIQADPELSTPASMPRTQLNDHIPSILGTLEEQLHLWSNKLSIQIDREHKEEAATHGLQRWQQGYHLRELTREWAHLHSCLMDELELFAKNHSELELGTTLIANRIMTKLCTEGVCESTTRFFQMQQTEAEGHVRDLEQTLNQVQAMERQRSELWRQVAHDLRGNLGVVLNATAGLTLEGIPEPARNNFFRLLQKSVSALHTMLEDVAGLARLQAGHEKRNIDLFDATILLRELSESLQSLADDRGLFLKAVGPDSLEVYGDRIKVRRIVQNLLLNALKYTQQGGVTLTWGDSRENDSERWLISVEDTGPGFHAGPGAPLIEALKEATTESKAVEKLSGAEETLPSPQGDSSTSSKPDSRPIHQERGEGIGLSIIKRLCELLDASVEVESRPSVGTIFRVFLPRSYDVSGKN